MINDYQKNNFTNMKKENRLQIRFDDDELYSLKKMAKVHNLKPTEYIRELIKNDLINWLDSENNTFQKSLIEYI